MMSGGAVQLACQAVREEVFQRVRRRADAAGTALGGVLALEDGQVTAGGRRIGAIEDYLDEPVQQTRTYHHRPTQTLDEKGQGDVHVTLAFAAQRAVVDVDIELGLVKVVHVATACDVGRVMNPQGLEGQVEGGTAMGLGLALMEEVQVQDGHIRNASFTDYLIPTILDMPPVSTAVIEDPEPGVPYGAKGVAELPTIVSTPAIVAALRNATGRELNRVPVRPDDLIGLSPPVRTAGTPPAPDVPGPEPVPHYHGLGAGQQELMTPRSPDRK
jgi:CO/xanthine dehydrogenase Mo-binding subunit